jgi:GAF domain-containing protein
MSRASLPGKASRCIPTLASDVKVQIRPKHPAASCEQAHTRSGLRDILLASKCLILGMGAIQVASSRKGAKSRMHGRRSRSIGTKSEGVARSDEQAALVKKLKAHAGDLEKKLESRTRELVEARNHLAEALEQQTATSEVLRVISRSPGELEPIFQPMLANAVKLCEASYGAMWLREADSFHNAAFHGLLPAEYVERWRSTTVPIGSAVLFGPLVQSRKPVQVADVRETRPYLDGLQLPVAAADVAGIRTMAAVPMLKNDEVIGAIVIYRKEVRSFTDKQVEVVANFAHQAVIAIENARLLNELRQRTNDLSEALQQQTATSEVLRVISSSPGELELVFETMLANATRLCGAEFGILNLDDGDVSRIAAVYNVPPALAAAQNVPFRIHPKRPS